MDLNKVQIIGNITQDLELKQTPNGKNVVSFSIATNRNWMDATGMRQEQTEFHNLVLWWKLAEILCQYAWKWKKVYIEWRLQTRNWKAQDWTKRYRTEVVWENLILLWAKWDWVNSNIANANTTNSTPAAKTTTPKDEEEISVEDIPF